ncbi:MAG TPA: CBS domain-containing protein, partial [Coleofasciculaceae cyanobacterium]
MPTSPTGLMPAALTAAIVRQPLTVSPTATVMDAIAQMSGLRAVCSTSRAADRSLDGLHLESRSSCVLIVEDKQILGILTERDVVRLSIQQSSLDTLLIRDVMSSPVITLRESACSDLFFAVHLFHQHNIRHLPVLDEQDQLVGLLTHESLQQISHPINLLRLRLVAEVMTSEVICADPSVSMRAIAQLMAEHRISSVILVQQSSDKSLYPVGIVTQRDIVQFQALGLDFETCQAQSVMSTPIFSVSPEDSLWAVQQLMEQRLIQQLAVTGAQGELLGIVTRSNLLQPLNPLELYKLTEILERKVSRLEVEKIKLLENHALELERQVAERTAALQAKADREHLIATIATQIRSSLNLQDILDTMVTEVRSLLGCDRADIWQMQPDGSVTVLAESLTEGQLTHQGQHVQDTCFAWEKSIGHQQMRVVHDIYTTEMTPCHRQLLENLQIRAKILLPLFQQEKLWGLLSVVASHAPRNWQPEEITLLQQLSTQLEIAIHQATTYQQIQTELAERQRAETALRESEAHQSALISALPDLIMRVDREGTYLEFIATNTFKIIGNTGDFIGTKVHDSLPFELAERRMDAIRTVLQTGSIQFYEQALWVDGQLQTEEVRVVPCRKNEVLLLVRDITDRKQTENALRQSEAENRAIIAAIPDLMFRVGADGRYRGYVTHRHSLDILSPDVDPTGQRVADLLPAELAERQMRYLQRALTTGELQIYEQQIQIGDRLQDEEVRVIKSGDDEVLCMIRDISEAKQDEAKRKQAEAALVREVIRSKMLFNTSVDGIVILDDQGNVIETNPSFAKMLGYTSEEVVTLNIFDLDAKWTHEELQKGIQEFTLNKRVMFETRHRRKDGSICDVEISANSIDWDGKNVQFCICRDITQRKQTEAALHQLNQELEDRVVQRTIALQQSEALLRQAQQVAHLGSWQFDVITGTFTGSPELFHIFGFGPDEPEPTYEQLTQYYYPGARKRQMYLLNRAIELGEPYATDLQIKRVDGSSIYVFVKGE